MESITLLKELRNKVKLFRNETKNADMNLAYTHVLHEIDIMLHSKQERLYHALNGYKH
jgi:hypothetical protein